ncbi:MAG TPA: Fic family protein [Conexibacter sp.]|jgi:death-on-curing protein|nr:Fic family protein [Conexibacter sp.]
MEKLSIEDLLLIAEAVLGISAERLARAAQLGAAASALAAPFVADGEGDRHPGLGTKAAILCSRLVRNHPLPDGNKRVALLAMLELVARNGGIWTPPIGGQDEIATTVERLAARELSEAAFTAWVRARVRSR